MWSRARLDPLVSDPVVQVLAEEPDVLADAQVRKAATPRGVAHPAGGDTEVSGRLLGVPKARFGDRTRRAFT